MKPSFGALLALVSSNIKYNLREPNLILKHITLLNSKIHSDLYRVSIPLTSGHDTFNRHALQLHNPWEESKLTLGLWV